MKVERNSDELERLAQSDTDPFARYEAMQELMLQLLIAGSRGEPVDTQPLIRAVSATLKSNSLDPALKADAMMLPTEAVIGDRMDQVDPDAIHASRERLRAELAAALRPDLLAIHGASAPGGDDLSPRAKGLRKLRNGALSYLAAADPAEGARLAKQQFETADNMTARQGALAVLVSLDAEEREEALRRFYSRFEQEPLVIDKWFGLQAMAQREGTLDEVERLAKHPAFTIANPNRLRALVGTFSANQWLFHRADGRGYRFLADMILAVDKLNPQMAARFVPPLGRWRRFDEQRQALMREQLQRIVDAEGLSKDTYEQASKSLA
jgi:aminopeptidase N